MAGLLNLTWGWPKFLAAVGPPGQLLKKSTVSSATFCWKKTQRRLNKLITTPFGWVRLDGHEPSPGWLEPPPHSRVDTTTHHEGAPTANEPPAGPCAGERETHIDGLCVLDIAVAVNVRTTSMVGISTPHLSRSCSTAICLTVCAPAPSWPCASCATLRYMVCLAPQADLLHHLGPSKLGMASLATSLYPRICVTTTVWLWIVAPVPPVLDVSALGRADSE
eukprot:m.108045 g.108045  ORF g.108045 m.108045 type:complete len:221 (+) comp21187_c0_seq1:858-1520(+)